uniref:Uncharacterized protein n=1 Tax=Daphnia galeata TaxID=27404 RepID=A0A8J2RXD3_9CRUS|nr:unnamed protein product [Daphnia galeata]
MDWGFHHVQCYADSRCLWCTWEVGLNLSKFCLNPSLLLGMWLYGEILRSLGCIPIDEVVAVACQLRV